MTDTPDSPRHRQRRPSTLRSFLLGVILGVLAAVGAYLYFQHKQAEPETTPATAEPTIKMETPPAEPAAAPPPVAAPAKPAPTPAAPHTPKPSDDRQVQDDAAAAGMTSVNPPVTPSLDQNGEPATN